MKTFPRYWPFARGIHRSPVNSPPQRPVTLRFHVFFDLRLNKCLNKHSWCCWFETPLRSLWRHCNRSGHGWRITSPSFTWWGAVPYMQNTSLVNLPLDKMAAISQTIFSGAFSWMKSFVFWLKFYWSLFLRVQFTIIQHWFRKWLGVEKATSQRYLKECCADSRTH